MSDASLPPVTWFTIDCRELKDGCVGEPLASTQCQHNTKHHRAQSFSAATCVSKALRSRNSCLPSATNSCTDLENTLSRLLKSRPNCSSRQEAASLHWATHRLDTSVYVGSATDGSHKPQDAPCKCRDSRVSSELRWNCQTVSMQMSGRLGHSSLMLAHMGPNADWARPTGMGAPVWLGCTLVPSGRIDPRRPGSNG